MIGKYLAYKYGKRRAHKNIVREIRRAETDAYDKRRYDYPNYPEGGTIYEELYWLATGKNLLDD